MRTYCLGMGVGALVLVVAAAGCGGANKPVKIKGKVTLDSQPVEGALVTFLAEGKNGRDANGRTRADGSFELTTFAPNDGALPGEYKVVVQYQEPPELPSNVKNQQEAQKAIQQGKGQTKKPPRYTIPPAYSDRSKTILHQKVPPDGEVLLELKSGV